MDIETEAVQLITDIVGEDQLEKIHKFVNEYFSTLARFMAQMGAPPYVGR
jgi:hypothetical protein